MVTRSRRGDRPHSFGEGVIALSSKARADSGVRDLIERVDAPMSDVGGVVSFPFTPLSDALNDDFSALKAVFVAPNVVRAIGAMAKNLSSRMEAIVTNPISSCLGFFFFPDCEGGGDFDRGRLAPRRLAWTRTGASRLRSSDAFVTGGGGVLAPREGLCEFDMAGGWLDRWVAERRRFGRDGVAAAMAIVGAAGGARDSDAADAAGAGEAAMIGGEPVIAA